MYKEDFPIFKKYPNLSYLDSAATTQKPDSVIQSISEYYSEYNANVHRGIYDLSENSTKLFEQSREKIARFIGSHDTQEIIFTSGTTDSINLVASSWVPANLEKGDTILLSNLEHHSNFLPWQQIALKHSIQIDFVNLSDDFVLNLQDLENKLKKHSPKLICLSHIANITGTTTPISHITKLCRNIVPNIKVLVDAAQSIAHIPTNVKAMDVDFLAFSGHKAYGPTGTGVLFIKKENLDSFPPAKFGGGMIINVEKDKSDWADAPTKFEAGTPNIAGICGLAKALEYIERIGIPQIQQHEMDLKEYCLREMQKVQNLTVYIPKDTRYTSGVISFWLDGIHPHDVAQICSYNKVAIRAGHHCNKLILKENIKKSALSRASFGIYNTKDDIDKLITAIKKTLETFK